VTALAAGDRRLIAALADGLPLVPRPYDALGAALGWTEAEVIARLRGLVAAGVVSRFGVIVRHHELGIRANAMVVWDVPDARVADAGAGGGSTR
jgi:siroheme decarboxylase